jgi:chitinase
LYWKNLEGAMRLIAGVALAGVCFFGPARGYTTDRTHTPKEQVVGYILGGRGGPLNASTIAGAKMTRINYAFFRLREGVMVATGVNDAANLAVLTGLKKDDPALEILVSVGGGGEGSAGFSDMALTAPGRAKFVDSAVEMIEKYNLDGIDVDWEYPGYTHVPNAKVRAEDKENYTLLLKELRLRLDAEGKKLGRHLVTSSATGATQIWLDHTDMREASKWLDSVNMMCYDWYNPVEKNAGHDSPLYTNPADPKSISIDNAVKMNLAAGVPAGKLVIGVPFYGREWTGVEAGATHGLWQPIASTKPGVELVYRGIEPMVNSQGFVRYWDDIAEAPYLYNKETKTFVTYNDAEAERARAKYVKQMHLGGIMFWQYTGDAKNVLLDAIDQGFNEE